MLDEAATREAHLSRPMARFIARWRAVGGAGADIDDVLTDEWRPACLSYSLRGGVWRYDFVGAAHDRINGERVAGRLEKRLTPAAYAQVAEAVSYMIERGEPIYTEFECCVGRSAGRWCARVSAPIAPRDGAEAAILSLFEWRDGPDEMQDDRLRHVVERFFGAEIARTFADRRDGLVFAAQRHLLGMIVASDDCTVTAEDRGYVAERLANLWKIRPIEAYRSPAPDPRPSAPACP